MHKKFFYRMVLFSALISFAFVNVASAHFTNSGNTSSFYDNGSKHPNVINGDNSSDSNSESFILARSDKSKKSKKSEKSKKSDKSKKSEKSLKSEKSKKSDKSAKSKKRGKSKGKGKGKKKGHHK